MSLTPVPSNTHHPNPTNEIPTPNGATFSPPTNLRATETYGGLLALLWLEWLSVRFGKQKECKSLFSVELSRTGYGHVCWTALQLSYV
jgi:hypothetical protein